MRNYNYVFFNSKDNNRLHKNPDGYYTICAKDLEALDDVCVVSYPVDFASTFVRFLFGVHHTERLNKHFKLPFKRLWYPYYYKYTFSQSRPLCFVLLNPYIPIDYIKYIKATYPDAKIVALHRDLLSVYQKICPDFIKNPLFDLEMSIDPEESKKYGMLYFDEFESKIDILPNPEIPVSDVFFAGKAKDRVERLVKAYDILSEAGLKCLFYITCAKENEQIERSGIIYGKKPLSYRRFLEYTLNARCILEINQENAFGYTSRFLEAVLYNKLLITDNKWVKNSKYYRPDYIDCIENIKAIDPKFITDFSGTIDYEYQGEFSPVRLIDQIDQALTEKFGEPKSV